MPKAKNQQLQARYTFEAIGTQWSIETTQPLSKELRAQIQAHIVEFSEAYSRFDKTSLVSQLRNHPGEAVTFPGSLTQLLEIYRSLHKITNGRVNPLVGGSLEALGYDATYSLRPQTPSPAPPFASLQLDGNSITATQPVLLDIGAIGKGLLVDELSRLVSASHPSYVIDGSGDVAVCGSAPQRIGLEDPRDPQRVLGYVELSNGSLCASATNRRNWGDGLHHILDATTGLPAQTEIVATWAVAQTTLVADALTTGLFFASAEALASTFGDFYYAILNKDGSMLHNIDSIGEIYS